MIECVECKEMSFSYHKEMCLKCGSGATLFSRNEDISEWWEEEDDGVRE